MAKETAFYGVQDISARAIARLSTQELVERLDLANRDLVIMTGHERTLTEIEKHRIETELLSRA